MYTQNENGSEKGNIHKHAETLRICMMQSSRTTTKTASRRANYLQFLNANWFIFVWKLQEFLDVDEKTLWKTTFSYLIIFGKQYRDCNCIERD